MNSVPAAESDRVSAPSLPSAPIREYAAQALRAGATHYTDRAGIPAVRAAVAGALGGAAGLLPEQVIITTGREEALFLALRGSLERGSIVANAGEPLLPAEAGGYEGLLDSLGLSAVSWPLAQGTERLWPGALVIVDDGRDVMALVDRAADLGVIPVVLEALGADSPPGSLAASGIANNALLIGDLAAAGLRSWGVGYVAGPPELLQALIDLKQGLNICTAAVSQHAAVAAAGELCGPADAALAVAGPLAGNAANRPRRLTPRATVSDEATRQRYELLDLLAATPGAITLGRGDPDLPTPPPIVEAAIAAMDLDAGPVDPLGLPQLRRAIAAKLEADNGIVVDPEREILITTGGQEAIFLVLQTLLKPGDEILMPSPRYTSYDVAVNVAGARIVDVPPPGPLDFSLDADAIEQAITARTKALLVITPGNPTAAVIDARRLAAVAEVAKRHELIVISDEMYERIVYDDVVHTSIASLPGMGGRAITVGGFSKAYAMTGWRVGYLVGPPQAVAAAAQLKQLWSGPTSTIAQYGALAALREGPELVREAVAVYARRRAMTLEALRSFGIAHAPAQGAFYVFFDVSEFGLSSFQVSRGLLLRSGVFLYPGSAFGSQWSGHMRLAWLQPEDLLEQALTRIGDWIGRHR